MPENPIIDEEVALARMGGDKQLLSQLAEFFLADAPALLRDLEIALVAQHADAVHHAAHSLKGLGSNFDAAGLVSTARQIEVLSAHGDLAACQSLSDQLREEHEQVIAALKAMLERNGRPAG
jgi:HPt (histidine-containing phosphotransfer) domain-containing protein